jgi:hypothetical protein
MTENAYGRWSGCRDSNPGPSVPQTDALTKLRHSPSTWCAPDGRWYSQGCGNSEVLYDPFDALKRPVAEVDGERAEHEFEVPGDGIEWFFGVGLLRGGWRRFGERGVVGMAGVDGVSASGAGAVGVDGGRREETVARRTPGHGVI